MKFPKLTGVEWAVILAIFVLGAIGILCVCGLSSILFDVEVIKVGVVKDVDFTNPDKVVILWEDGTQTVLDEDYVSNSLSFQKGKLYTLQRKGFTHDLVLGRPRPKTK